MHYAIIALLLIASVAAKAETPATDNPIEQLAKQLDVGRTEGTLIWLEAGGSKTFAVVSEAAARAPQGGIILLHDLGAHGDSTQLIAPLRQRLAQYGWTCMSVHVPALNEQRQAPAADLTKHIQDLIGAASQQLAQKNMKLMAVVAHGASAPLAASALGAAAGSIRALVALSPSVPKTPDPALDMVATYRALNLPLLDVYGEADYPAVIQQADARAAAKRTGTPANDALFRQIVIPGADHQYLNQEDLLTRRIVGWLRKTLSPE